MACVRGVTILALDPDPEWDFQLFDDSGFGSNKKRICNSCIEVL